MDALATRCGTGYTGARKEGRQMFWWAWIVLAAALLVAELIVPTDFYLAVLGSAAAAVGLLNVVGLDVPVWAEWLLFAVFSVMILVTFRHFWPQVTDRDRRSGTVVGEVAIAGERIDSGMTGRVEVRGVGWSARNVGSIVLDEGDRARVVLVEGVTIHVESESSSTT